MTRGNGSIYPSSGSSAIVNATERMNMWRSRSAEFQAGTQHEGQQVDDFKDYGPRGPYDDEPYRD